MIKKVKTLKKTLKNCLLDIIASREGAAKVIIASAYAEYKNNVTLGLRLEASHVTIKNVKSVFFFVCISHQSPVLAVCWRVSPIQTLVSMNYGNESLSL